MIEDVRQTLASLGRLQDLETALATIATELARIPPRIAEIEATLSGAEKELAQARSELQAAVKDRRSLETDIETVKAKISRYTDQLLQVKTNDQYRVLNQEIATERGVIAVIEEKILYGMERADDLGRVIKDREAFLARERDRIATEKKTLGEQQRLLETERLTSLEERGRTEKEVPKEALVLYRRFASTRAGIGLARINGDACGECRVRARPHTLQRAKAFELIVQCESCQRILMPPKELFVAPDGTAPAGA